VIARAVAGGGLAQILLPAAVQRQGMAGRDSDHRRLQAVTIPVADLRDFSRWMASTPTGEVADGLSAYFTETERAIRRHGGVVPQFIGDEI
jgi:class 3 adenylate cyclase